MQTSVVNDFRDKCCKLLPVEKVECHMRPTAAAVAICQTTAAFPSLWPRQWQHRKFTTNIKTEHSMLIFISTICLPADLAGGHLSRDKPLFVKRFNQARLKERAAFRRSFFFFLATQTVPMWQCLPVEIRAAPDAVVAEVLLGLFRTVVFARVWPQQVTHGPESRRLLEPVQLHSARHSEQRMRQAVKKNP